MTCEKPSAGERAIGHWSQREIADEAMRRGPVPSISQRSVGRFLKRGRPQPHRVRYWLTPKPDPAFDTKCAGICATYKAAAGADDTHRTVSIDEMTGIQALERIAPGLPMMPGKVERREFEYRRHGTQTLIAAFDVATGKVEGMISNTRMEKDFARFLRRLLRSRALNTRWDIVCDNLNTHLSRSCTPRRSQGQARCESQVGRARVQGHTPGVPAPARPSRHLPFHAQARNLVLHSGAKTPSPR
jgi:hypothetical protein